MIAFSSYQSTNDSLNDLDQQLVATAMCPCSLYQENNVSDTKFTTLPMMPVWRTAMWSAFFGLMVIVSIAGNAIVIWIVLSNRKMRTVTNYFLVNLSVSDIALSALNTSFSFVSMVTDDWPFGRAHCTVTQYVAVVSVGCSVFTLMAISIERYLAIIYPLRKRTSKSATGLCVALVWLVSLLFALPHALYATTRELFDESGGTRRILCLLAWPDGTTFKSRHEFVYNWILTVATYIVPVTSMAVTYAHIGKKLWGSKAIGEPTEQQLENIQSKRKIVKMLIAVVTIFAVCWLPYHGYFLASWLYPAVNDWKHIQDAYLAIYWLAMSSSMYSPFIYCWMNSRFRLGFKRALSCSCSRRRTRFTFNGRLNSAVLFSFTSSSNHMTARGSSSCTATTII